MVSQLPCPCNISHSGSDLFFFYYFFGVDKDRLFGMVYYVGEHGRSSYFFITRSGTSFFGDEGWVWFSSSQYCWLYLTSPRFYGASSGYLFISIAIFRLSFFNSFACVYSLWFFSLSLEWRTPMWFYSFDMERVVRGLKRKLRICLWRVQGRMLSICMHIESDSIQRPTLSD